MKATLFICIFLLESLALWAHPHIFIDGRLSVFITDKNIEEVKVEWILDEMTSASFLMDFDMNFDGILSEEEALPLAQNMAHFEQNQYYTHLLADGEEINWKPPYNIKITLEEGHIVYRFNLSPKNGSIPFKEAYLGIWDESYFSNVQWNPSQPFCLECISDDLNLQKTSREDFSYMGGQMIPEVYYVRWNQES